MDAAFVELDPEIGQIHPGVVPPPQQNELEVISQEGKEAYQAKQNRLLRWSNHLLGALKVLEFKVRGRVLLHWSSGGRGSSWRSAARGVRRKQAALQRLGGQPSCLRLPL